MHFMLFNKKTLKPFSIVTIFERDWSIFRVDYNYCGVCLCVSDRKKKKTKQTTEFYFFEFFPQTAA